MRPTPRRLLAAATTTLAVTTLTSAVLGASAAGPTEGDGAASGSTAPTVTIRPGAMPRGANPQVPWVFDATLFHGSLRAAVPGDAWLLGASGGDYLLFRPGDEVSRVLRVAPDGSRTRVLELPAAHQVMLAEDGSALVRTAQRRVDGEWRTVLRTHDPVSGELLDRRRFTGIVDVLAADARRAVLGSWTPRQRTLVWDLAADTTRLLLRQTGYVADLGADRLGTFTADPYLDGCAVLRRLSAPGEVLSRSCDERAAAISPAGRRVASIHILSDGLGPREVSVRRDTGRRLAGYRVGGWFGRMDFESDGALLLEASGREKQAVVRCEGSACERATRTRTTPTY